VDLFFVGIDLISNWDSCLRNDHSGHI
jgi:hypothetical protein